MRPFRLRVETDTGQVFDESVLLFLLLNGTDVAGFSDVIDRADMRDGYMDLLIVREGKLWESLQAGLQIVHVLKNAKSIVQIRCRRCKIIADPAPVVSIDGERGAPLPYTVEMLPAGLRLLGQTDAAAHGKKPLSAVQTRKNVTTSFAEYLARALATEQPCKNADGTYTIST
jgi:diacylglycerol kinase family enzyme